MKDEASTALSRSLREQLDMLSNAKFGEGDFTMSVTNGIVVCTKGGKEIVYMDRAACELLGYAQDALLGHSLYRLLPKGLREDHSRIMESRAGSSYSSDMATRAISAIHSNGSSVEMNAVVHYTDTLRAVLFVTAKERMAALRKVLDAMGP